MLSLRHVTDGLLKGTDAAQAAQYVAMEKATAAQVLKTQEEAPHAPGQTLHGTGVPRDVKSETVPLTVHHAQSSPVVIQPSQLSSTLLNPAQHLPGGTGPPPASPPAVPQEATSAPQSAQAPASPQMPPNGSATQSFFIEEIHSAGTKSRAVSIEVRVRLPWFHNPPEECDPWSFPRRVYSLRVVVIPRCVKGLFSSKTFTCAINMSQWPD